MSPRRAVLVLAGAALLGACDDHADTRAYDIGRPQVTLRGVGASVSKALFAKWAEQYALVDPTVTLTYDPAGSTAGVKAALAGTGDFAVSDTALSDGQAASARQVLEVPVAVEAIAIVYSVAALGTTRLQLSEDVIADMLTGQVKAWDDPAIAALNSGVKLPHVTVHPLYRSDPSGTSDLVSEWLAKASRRWPKSSASASIFLPNGIPVAKEGGMISRLHDSDGALGYLSAVTALAQHLQVAAVPNSTGRYVTPTLEAMRAAASTIEFGADLRAHLVSAPGDLSYPICSFTFALLRRDRSDEAARTATARFFWWATHEGQSFAPPLGFGALPGAVQLRDESALRSLPLGRDKEL